MPKQWKWYMGLETNQVFERRMRKGLGDAKTSDFFFDGSIGIFDWLCFDGRLGMGDTEFDTIEAGRLDFNYGFAGAYGLRFKIYDNEARGMRSILGFQHISVHPPKKESGSTKYGAIWDEWQISLLLAKRVGRLNPYAGIKASELFLIRKDNFNTKSHWNGARDHFGVILGSNFNISGNCYVNLEGRLIDEDAVSMALIYKL